MNLLLSLLFAASVLLSACATVPAPQSTNDKPLLLVAAIDGPGLFAAAPKGRKVAISKDGLSLFDLESGASQKLSPLEPSALAWSPDGLVLIASYELAGYETTLLFYSLEGVVVRELSLPVTLTQLAWSARSDLLATGFALQVYSFGGNLKQTLYRIDEDVVEEIVLTDTTLRPSLVTRLAPDMLSLQPVTFSPYGDELVFLFLHDPPEFPPYLQLIYRNWTSVKVRVFHRMPLQAVEFEWHPAGDSVEIHTKEGSESLELWQPLFNNADSSFQDMYRFFNGRLYKGTKLLVDWGEGAQLQMLASGQFMLAVNNSLYLGSGLQTVSVPTYNEEEWNLRRWRYEELITPDEYHSLLQRSDK